MSRATTDPFSLAASELAPLLASSAPFVPELEAARANPALLRDAPQTRIVLGWTATQMETLERFPHTSYTRYRQFQHSGDRRGYETPYFAKRSTLAGAALRLFFGRHELKDRVQDYIWDICEESTWVVPAHENRLIDLFAAETGFVLAETLSLLGSTLDVEVRHRVRQEVARRIFEPFLRYHHSQGWYMGSNNWNGVCSSAIAASFLYLEPEPERAAQALELALRSLRVYLDTAFEPDGSSSEGVAYWHYGLINFVALAEMLRARSAGAIDLLDSQQLRRVAAYPAKLLLSGSCFASFSDCDETVSFNPGIIARLAERTGERSLWDLLARSAELGGDWRLSMMLRNLLWWDGSQGEVPLPADAVLPASGVARLVAFTSSGTPVVAAIKAGHNAENHNQNDIGSFVVHVAGENLLTDPGRGLYSRAYFGPERYDNIFASSFGHSVPRIGGALQAVGRQYAGQLLTIDTAAEQTTATLELARAYPVASLEGFQRRLMLATAGAQAGTIYLHDSLRFGPQGPEEVEEALITWLDVAVDGGVAHIRGRRHALRLVIEAPEAAQFVLHELREESAANAKPDVLKRLSFVVPAAGRAEARVRMELKEIT